MNVDQKINLFCNSWRWDIKVRTKLVVCGIQHIVSALALHILTFRRPKIGMHFRLWEEIRSLLPHKMTSNLLLLPCGIMFLKSPFHSRVAIKIKGATSIKLQKTKIEFFSCLISYLYDGQSRPIKAALWSCNYSAKNSISSSRERMADHGRHYSATVRDTTLASCLSLGRGWRGLWPSRPAASAACKQYYWCYWQSWKQYQWCYWQSDDVNHG